MQTSLYQINNGKIAGRRVFALISDLHCSPVEDVLEILKSAKADGAVTVAVTYYAEKEILFEVDRESFMPAPNVDSAVIKLNIRKEPAVNVQDGKKFFNLVKACFAQRRKNAGYCGQRSDC